MTKIIAFIPCHMDSIRFPGKAMTIIKGYPMIEHVYRRAKLIKEVDDVIITTCDDKIYEYCLSKKINVTKSSNIHKNGTSRVAETIESLNITHALILQGDEPLINPNEINSFIKKVKEHNKIPSWNLISKLNNQDQMKDKTIVKCKITNEKIIELFREKNDDYQNYNKILGVFCFTKFTLKKYVQFLPCNNEIKLMIEQIRLLKNNIEFNSYEVKDNDGSVNIPSDKKKVINELENNNFQKSIYKKAFNFE